MRRRMLGLGLLAAAALVLAPSAVAGTTHVSGSQILVDPATGEYTMDGGLVGAWYTTSFDFRYHPAGTLQGWGTELFVGCLDADADGACGAGDPTGTLDYSFTYEAKFDPVTGALLRGSCHHPVVGGTGDFSGATGVLTMKDSPTDTSYKGWIDV